MTVEFPFVEVTDIDVVFGGIPNYDSVLEACPQEFYESNRFSSIASKWFNIGLDPETDLAGYAMSAKSMEEAIMQRKYVEAWLGSFRPKHQEKIAVTGWLLSLMLVEPEKT